MQLWQKVKKHYLILLISVCLGLLSSLPQYFGAQKVPGFSGIYHGVVDDGIYYQARVKDVLDGHSRLSNPYFAEHKDGLPMQFWLPDYILAKLIGWLGVSIPVGFILWTLILVPLLILLSYGIIFLLTESVTISTLGATALHVSLFAFKFLRLPSPTLNFVFWLSTLLFFILFLKYEESNSDQSRKYLILTTLSFGLLFHIYPYYWTFYVGVFGIFIFLNILKGERYGEIKIFITKIISIILIGFIIGIPYFISLLKASQLPTYAETMSRLGMLNTHFPSGIDTLFWAGIVLVLFIISFYKKILKINNISLLLLSGTLATVIITNQHVITGKNLEFSSHYFLGNIFWLFFSFVYIFYSWIVYLFPKGSQEIGRKYVLCALSIFVVFTSFFSIKDIIQREITYSDSEIYQQKYMPILNWLDINSTPEEVVYSNDDISYFVPIYTSLNVYYNTFGILFFLSDKEALDRYIIANYFDDFTPEYVKERERSILGAQNTNLYGKASTENKIRKLLGLQQLKVDRFPKADIDKVLEEAKILQSRKFNELIKTYKVNYIIVDRNKDTPREKKLYTELQNKKYFTFAFTENGIEIYKVN